MSGITSPNLFRTPNISRVRIDGGSRGQYLRIATQTDTPEFKHLTLRDITGTDTATNQAAMTLDHTNLILTSANTNFGTSGESTNIIFKSGTTAQDTISLFATGTAASGESDLVLSLIHL